MTVWLNQTEAEALCAMEKHRVDERLWRLHDMGGIVAPLVSADGDDPFAFLNDNEKIIAGKVMDALRIYGITPVAWSQRDQFRERLVA